MGRASARDVADECQQKGGPRHLATGPSGVPVAYHGDMGRCLGVCRAEPSRHQTGQLCCLNFQRTLWQGPARLGGPAFGVSKARPSGVIA